MVFKFRSAVCASLLKQLNSATVEDGTLHGSSGAFICWAAPASWADETKKAHKKNERDVLSIMRPWYIAATII